eukprot:13517137-Heterocapsa_arctica.AAC.1
MEPQIGHQRFPCDHSYSPQLFDLQTTSSGLFARNLGMRLGTVLRRQPDRERDGGGCSLGT